VSGQPKNKPPRKGPTVTPSTRSRGLVMLEPKGPKAKNPAWANATVVRTADDLVDAPPAAAGIEWLWAELPPLREWLVRQTVKPGLPLDPDEVVGRVAAAVEKQRPELGGVPPQEYLRTLAGKLVLMAA
jgi:hypothetical protein